MLMFKICDDLNYLLGPLMMDMWKKSKSQKYPDYFCKIIVLSTKTDLNEL